VSTGAGSFESPLDASPGRSPVRLTPLDGLIGAVAVLVVAAPMLFTSSGFALDFTNHLWLTWVAGKELAQTGYPGYFLNTTGLGVFYPMFAFYGGTLYATTGAIGELLGGHPLLAYVGVTTLAIASAYGGTLWLGRQLGVRGLIGHAPALAVITSAYYVTDLYGRGAWPELMATSAIAPLLAGGVHLVRTSVWRPLPIVVFVISVVIFSGSHNLTLLWGTAVGILALLVMWLALGAARRLPYRRLGAVAALGVTSVLVNAWFLFPDLAFERNVAISNEASVSWSGTSFFNTPAVLLDPLRYVPSQSGTPGLFVQVPTWFLAWGLAAGALLLWRGRAPDRLRRAWLGVATLIVVLLAMIMLEAFWEVVPFPFSQIQFPYRLGSYVFYAIAGLVLVGALALQRIPEVTPRRATVRGLGVALAAAAAISLGLCVWQGWVPNTMFPKSYKNRSAVLASTSTLPRSWYDGGSFRDVSAPAVAIPEGRVLVIPPELVRGGRFAAWMNVPPGPAPIRTNITGGSYLVHIAGLERVGHGPGGEAIVRRIGAGSGPVHVVIETADSAPVEVGRAVSVLALLLLLGVVARAGVHARRVGRVARAELESGKRTTQVGAPTG
jgi:hypothetical protein